MVSNAAPMLSNVMGGPGAEGGITHLYGDVFDPGSGDIPATAMSDGLVEIPPGESGPGPWPFYSWSGA